MSRDRDAGKLDGIAIDYRVRLAESERGEDEGFFKHYRGPRFTGRRPRFDRKGRVLPVG